jgi:hypothetical protein
MFSTTTSHSEKPRSNRGTSYAQKSVTTVNVWKKLTELWIKIHTHTILRCKIQNLACNKGSF